MIPSFAALPFDRATALALIDPVVHARPDVPPSAQRCLAAALAVSIGTGAGPDELCAVHPHDLGTEAGIATIVVGARRSIHGRDAARTVPLLKPVRNVLEAYMRDRRKYATGGNGLFMLSAKQPLGAADLRTAIARCARDRSLGKGAQIRSARLTFAAALMRAQATEDLVAYLTARGGRARRSREEFYLRQRSPHFVLRLLNRHHVFGARYDEVAGSAAARSVGEAPVSRSGDDPDSVPAPGLSTWKVGTQR
ncbi:MULTISPECIES: tyrosine-type recombinase/integrase [Methylobacterium]|jgi:hypothetical protein|uniref:Tyr recombinase domain-containing protein n=5 Tax=Methylobacterium TaxID=407 RepID=A0AAJ1TPJ7_9HYPH|nr:MULTISPECIES: tyrosine-type recombinase/integrase [Methylobacterium]GAN46964.1 site-specific tyrosine recombinase XerC [Methylobacterium sp. ME121]MBN6823925.1 tyrosine-type recombinase/integrase [Methylobacterium organophilum]MCB4802327.1 site-specific integrase [Methylobacterium brachiatum]MDE4914391.1 tyrosine-type recombinase/integrase [Methylobacterium sp. 092160098-2]MDH2310623.1 tyrosine-type recombinase/integrase [Methylobacterium brachiatum]